MSISANYPALRPALLLDFANSQQLDPRVTFSRSTTAPYYDGKTSVLAEQNLTVQSQDWTQSVWIKTGLTVTANNWVAPDGTTTGTLLTSTTSTAGSTGTYQSITFAIGSTISFYATAGTANFIGALVGGVGCYANFNLGTGAVASSTGCTPSMVSIGGGTYRCIIANTSISGTVIILTGKDADPAASPWVNGVWTSGSTVKVWGFQVENRSSPTAYNPTTTSAITNYIPQLLTAPINAPRFDFNPTTGESLGLLIEQSSTNLQTYSSQMGDASWTVSNTTVTLNANIAPDGTQTATLGVQISGTPFIRRVATVSANTTYTTSVYAKAYASSTFVMVEAGVTGSSASFTLTGNGAVVVTNLGGSTSATITLVGNGWYRCTFTYTTGASQTTLYINNQTISNFVWGAQLEALAFPTSYIPTTSAQVTRAADVANITGTNFSSWFNQAEGTMYAETQTITTNTYAYIANLCDGGNGQNEIALRIETTNYRLSVVVNNIAQVNLTIGSYTAGGYNKTIMAYKTNDFAGTKNGGTVATATSGSLPTVNQLVLGTQRTAAPSAFTHTGTFKKIAYYPIRVTNAQLQALTGS